MLQSFAQDLKNLRASKNISLTEVAASTRINISTFEKIEEGDFTFQPQTYVRAFIKQYALAIDENPDDILKDYDLARTGKYKQKFTPEKEQPVEEVQAVQTEEKPEEIKKEQEKKPVHKHRPADIAKPEKPKTEKNVIESGSSINPAVLKTAGTIAVVLLICTGLYFLITSLFFTSSGNNVEIQRQSFDDVVKQNEKNILGKRTEEEIQDSIRKAEEHFKQQQILAGDTLRLEVLSSKNGTIRVNADSLNKGQMESIDFGPNQLGDWKALKFFIISSPNTATFTAKLNGNVLVFPEKTANRVKVTKDGIVSAIK